MNRLLVCISIALLCCSAAAQTAAFASTAPASPETAATAASPTAHSQVELFQKIDDAWSMAINNHDQFGLENVLSPSYFGVAATGATATLNQIVAQVISNGDKALWLSQRVTAVRVLGDVAVANGDYSLRHTVNGKPVEQNGVFTQVFRRTRGNWMCINSQRTRLPRQAQTSQRRPATAADGFHLPFF